jgi:hypothetical protein
MPHFVTLVRYTQQGLSKSRKAHRDSTPLGTLRKRKEARFTGGI